MEALRKLAGPRTFLMVGNSKLISYDNVHALIKAGVQFGAPTTKTYVKAETLAEQQQLAATDTVDVDHIAERDTGKPAEQRGRWRVREDTMTLPAPKGSNGPTLALRRVFVHSSHRADAAQVARARKLDRARDDLGRLERGLGGITTPTPQPSSSASARSSVPAASAATCRPRSGPTP